MDYQKSTRKPILLLGLVAVLFVFWSTGLATTSQNDKPSDKIVSEHVTAPEPNVWDQAEALIAAEKVAKPTTPREPSWVIVFGLVLAIGLPRFDLFNRIFNSSKEMPKASSDYEKTSLHNETKMSDSNVR